jgi:hypothetical protein
VRSRAACSTRQVDLAPIEPAGTITKATADVLNAIRRGITSVQNAGYSPDTVLIDAAGAEALDLFRDGGSAATCTFRAGRFAPNQLFGLSVRTCTYRVQPWSTRGASGRCT